MRKSILIAIPLVLIALLGWGIYHRLTSGDDGNQGRRGGLSAVAVDLSRPRRRTMREIAEFTGTLLPNSRFSVAPKVPGRLERLLVNIGDTVHRGDLIAVLDSGEYAQQVAEAEAALEVSKASLADCKSELEVAQRAYDRARQLREQRVSSVAQLDQEKARHDAAVARMAVAQARINQQTAALAAAKVRLNYTQIHAAWEDDRQEDSRIVAERFVDEGSMLGANDPIVSIVDLSSVIAVIHVIERDFPKIRIGQQAAVTTDAWRGRVFAGQIVRMAPVLKEESRQGRVEVAVRNDEHLLAPGMFARVRIQFAEHADALAVPSAALVRRDGEQGVFATDVTAKTARFVAVQTGITDGRWVEIVSPSLDEPVVTLGQHLLTDGAAVILPDPLQTPSVASDDGAASVTEDRE